MDPLYELVLLAILAAATVAYAVTSRANPAQKLALSLRGQVLVVPNLAAIFPSWPTGQVNSNYERLKKYINTLIVEMMEEQARVKKHQADDIALFTALWYPHSGWDELKLLAIYVIWLFCWDDTVDTNQYSLAKDMDGAANYRLETIKHFASFLDVAPTESSKPELGKIDRVNRVLAPFCHNLARFCAQDRTLRFFDEVVFYIRSCEVEHRLQRAGRIPGYEEYIPFRLGTSAVFSLCALAEYALQMELPLEIIQSDDVKALWTQTNLQIIIVNDILSLKKELKTMCAINAVAATMIDNGGSLSLAVEALLGKLHRSVQNFDLAADRLNQSTLSDPKLNGEVRLYVDSLRTVVTGTLQFSLVAPLRNSPTHRGLLKTKTSSLMSKRYDIADCVRDDGCLEILL